MRCRDCSNFIWHKSFLLKAGVSIVDKRNGALTCGQKVAYRTAAELALILLLPVSVIELVARAALHLFADAFVLLSKICTKKIELPSHKALTTSAQITISILLILVWNIYSNRI